MERVIIMTDVRTEYNDNVKDNLVKMKYETSRSDLAQLNGGLFMFLMSLQDSADNFSKFAADMRIALPVLGVHEETPISKEVGSMIMEQLFDKLNPVLHDLAAIYVKIDGQQTCCEDISAVPEPIPPTGQPIDTGKDCDYAPTINLSLLARTERSLSSLMTVCATVERGVMNDFIRNQLITSMSQISDNLVDLAQEFNITGQDLRDADHDQSSIIPTPVYLKSTTCEGHCNCNNKKG